MSEFKRIVEMFEIDKNSVKNGLRGILILLILLMMRYSGLY